MNIDKTPSTGTALRTLDKTVRIARNLLAFVTILAIAFLLLALTGRGSMTVEADLDEPYVIEFADGRRVGIAGNMTTFENFEIGRERDLLADVGNVGLTVKISSTDLDTRLTLGTMLVLWLAAAWLGLQGLSQVVGAAARGSAFADDNPKWLRRLGAALIAVPVVSIVGTYILERTIETDIPISVSIAGTTTWVMAAIGLAVFALAEVFAEAARLREFEESTI